MALSPGTSLGVYEILSLLGKGGMGEIFKARDVRLDRLVRGECSGADLDYLQRTLAVES